MVITHSRDGRLLSRSTVVKVSPSAFEVRDASGAVTARVIGDGRGGFDLTGAGGAVLARLSAADAAAAAH